MTFKIPNNKRNPDGSVSLVAKEGAKIEVVGMVKEPTLANAQFDPFTPYKTEEDKYHYHALNVNVKNMREKKAQGYEVIPDTEYGDLILGRLPLAEHNRRIAKEEMKTKQRTQAAADQFKMEAEKLGVKTFE